jgi:hypothetical protein
MRFSHSIFHAPRRNFASYYQLSDAIKNNKCGKVASRALAHFVRSYLFLFAKGNAAAGFCSHCRHIMSTPNMLCEESTTGGGGGGGEERKIIFGDFIRYPYTQCLSLSHYTNSRGT